MAFVLTGVLVAGAAAATYYFYYNQPADNTPAIAPAVPPAASAATAAATASPEAPKKPETKPETAPAVAPAVAPERSISKKPETKPEKAEAEPVVKKPQTAEVKKPETVDSKKPEVSDSKKSETAAPISKNEPVSVAIAPEIKKREKEVERIPFATISKERSASIASTTADVILTNSTQKSAGAFFEFADNYVPNTKSMSRIMTSRPKTNKRKPTNWPLKKDISISEPTYENKPAPPSEVAEGTKSDGDDSSAPPIATPTKPRSFTKGSLILPAGFDPKVALRGLRGSTINKKT